MDYYRDLLDTVLRTLANGTESKVLSLVPDGIPNDSTDDRRRSERFEFPTALQPNNADVHLLLEGEPFLDASVEIVRNSSAECIFAYPPLLGNMRHSPEFYDRFGSLGLAEAVARNLVEHPDVPALVFAFLAPSQFFATMRCGRWQQQFFPVHSAVVLDHNHDVSEAFAFPAAINVPASTVVFTKPQRPVRFFKISESALAESTQRLQSDLKSLIQQSAEKRSLDMSTKGR